MKIFKFANFKKRIKKITSYNLILIICVVLLFASVSILFGHSIKTGALIASSGKTIQENYYLVEAGSFEKYDDALSLSNDIMSQGGAGYIRYDKTYKVFISAYLTESDAKSVISNLDGKFSIYTLSLGNFNRDNGLNESENSVIKNNLVCFKYVIENLVKLVAEFDESKSDILSVKQNCLLIKEEVDQQVEKYMDIFTQSTGKYRYKSYILDFQKDISNILTSELEKTDFSRLIHYETIDLMFILQKMVNNF